MRTTLLVTLTLVVIGITVDAAENGKEIEAVLKVHGEAVAKADKLHTTSIEKARDEAISKLIKLAGRAYTEKDRVSETNAWRTVLQLDRQHAKARRYFEDLGTLEQVEKELGEPKTPESVDLKKFTGKWNVMFSNRAGGPIVIPKDGVVRRGEGPNLTGKLAVENGEVLLRMPAFIERYTLMGDRVFVEQWAPASSFPDSAPLIFGYGPRIE